MLGKRSYVLGWDCHAGLWQISSPSGHVVHESASPHEISALCARLNRQFPRRRSALTRLPLRQQLPRAEAGALLGNLLSAMSPAYG
jgi:hypothetical protein